MQKNERKAVTDEMRTTWAGSTILNEINEAEMRAIVAAALATGATRVSLRRELDMSRHRFRAFMDGYCLLGEEWDRVARWCDGKATPQVSPYLVAVGVLCHWFPPGKVAKARNAVWTFVRELMEREKVRVPPFVSIDVDPPLPLQPLRRTERSVHGG